MVRYDVAIVGSGPAGAAAALTAHRLGLRAIIVDKAEFPRDKTCGDGLTTNALRLVEELGITREALAEPIRDGDTGQESSSRVGTGGYTRIDDIVLVGPRGRTVEIPLPRGRGDYACVVSRWRLDAALADLVAETSVERRLGVAIESITHDANRVALKLHNGDSIEADFVIAADGHWSTIRRSLHEAQHGQHAQPRDLGEWHAVRQYFSNASDRRLWVLFEPDLLPGYFWVFPLPNGRANVGYGVLREQGRSGKELKALWPDLLNRPHIKRILGPHAQPEGTVKAWPIPTNYEPEAMADGRVLYVGDAAKVVDPMTGEGIAQAIETGMLAAVAIAHYRHTANAAAAVATQYRAAVHRSLGRDLEFAARLQRVLAREAGARAALRVVDTNAWTRRNFARWMFEDYPRAVLFTPDRWRPNPFRRLAAFGPR